MCGAIVSVLHGTPIVRCDCSWFAQTPNNRDRLRRSLLQNLRPPGDSRFHKFYCPAIGITGNSFTTYLVTQLIIESEMQV